MALLRISDELALRTLSAFLMSGVATIALWNSVWTFTALTVLLSSAMCWEWGRAVRSQFFDIGHVVHISVISIVAIASAINSQALAIYTLVVGMIVMAVLSCKQHCFISIMGLVYIAVPVFSLIWLRNDEPYGIHAVFFIFLVVASHDTFAMLVGKLIGGPRIWPYLSPNKTWSGVIGGLASSWLTGLLFAVFFSYDAIVWLGGLGLIIGTAGFIGDLLESAFKRYYGLRHASSLIPGHGGVLDRFDGIITAVTVAILIGITIEQGSPARALMLAR
ncbi:MAG: phosphatidate cytidylyltransferase [Hyphomicrobiaceae bacterium]|nr:phosphatidate cytidylyltransferase [Hyphomicrobiaceae bacterium]